MTTKNAAVAIETEVVIGTTVVPDTETGVARGDATSASGSVWGHTCTHPPNTIQSTLIPENRSNIFKIKVNVVVCTVKV